MRLLRRVAGGAVTLLLVTFLVALLIEVAPGNALTRDAESEGARGLSAAAIEQLERLYHLDRPLHERYALWLADVVRGDFGRSLSDRRPVIEKIGERLPATLLLNVLALAVMVAIALPAGSAAALHPGGRLDRLAAGGTYLLYAVPVFWAALLLQSLLAVRLDWLPLAGLSTGAGGTPYGNHPFWDRLAHLVLPVICLAYPGLAYLSRFVRASLLDSAAADAVLAARARGLSPWATVWRHGMRQAAIPMLTLAGFLLPGLVTGSVIVEQVFSIPGLGRLFVEAALGRDVPVLMALTLLSGTATLAGILLADVLYEVADPRVRRG